ncbi:MAG: antibiotic biosynthesis monooxygenase [Bacteroidetes bacterium]|nr:antibiotic biosynthesis monooxygenase [Bacteroidota bacterium]
MKTKILIVLAILITAGMACKQKTPEVPAQPETSVQPVIMKKMITARVFVKPGKETDFITAAKVMVENSNKEAGCLGYKLYQDPYEKSSFIFVESYKDQAAIDFHFATSYFKEFGTTIADMVSEPADIKILDIAGEK